MKNFKESSKAVNKVIETLNFYEFYVVRVDGWSVTIQGEYTSSIAREIQSNFETRSEINSGFVELFFKLNEVSIKIVLT